MKPGKSTPAPLETDRGQQKDDNIDELGRRPDGTEQDQPVHPGRKTETGDKPGSSKQ